MTFRTYCTCRSRTHRALDKCSGMPSLHWLLLLRPSSGPRPPPGFCFPLVLSWAHPRWPLLKPMGGPWCGLPGSTLPRRPHPRQVRRLASPAEPPPPVPPGTSPRRAGRGTSRRCTSTSGNTTGSRGRGSHVRTPEAGTPWVPPPPPGPPPSPSAPRSCMGQCSPSAPCRAPCPQFARHGLHRSIAASRTAAPWAI